MAAIMTAPVRCKSQMTSRACRCSAILTSHSDGLKVLDMTIKVEVGGLSVDILVKRLGVVSVFLRLTLGLLYEKVRWTYSLLHWDDEIFSWGGGGGVKNLKNL
jgi:hypothetical protein